MDQVPPPGWTREGNALTRTVKRADFAEALGFLVAVGRLAEAANHHPDIDLRYNKVHLSLSTHDAGHTITAKDFSLAQEISDLGDDTVRAATQNLRPLLAR